MAVAYSQPASNIPSALSASPGSAQTSLTAPRVRSVKSAVWILIEHLVHLITEPGRRLVEYVSPEVGLASLPDQARKGRFQRPSQSAMSVAGRHIHTREAVRLGTLNIPAPHLTRLAEGDLRTEQLAPALVTKSPENAPSGRAGWLY